MKTYKAIPTWATILTLLLLSNLLFMSWGAFQRSGKQFRFEVLHTNNMSGFGLFDSKANQPVWTRFNEDGFTALENHFFRGQDVFDITIRSNRPPIYNIYFHGLGKSVEWWLNAGGGNTFTERILYDTNGDLSRNEIWYNQAWHAVDRRDGKNGITINGQWRQLAFDTNGMWTVETAITP
jgi:hypothetical protein